ncbi:MAG: type VI secretion system tip protein VgrG [Gammaproteobacteria bacterium]|nr:type VI secretion system tip protein VgrG [Gammaproteobacteria bacterium]
MALRPTDANTVWFTLEIEGGQSFAVLEFSGNESISELYQFNVTIVSEDNLSMPDLLAKSVQLSFQPDNCDSVRELNGIISRIDFSKEVGYSVLYKIEIVPICELLKYRGDNRIFQELSVEDIITKVFETANIPSDMYSFNLNEQHALRHYCVQFGETDFAFISRLMEEEGIFYYFEHNNGEHVMIITDQSAVLAEIEGAIIDYQVESGLASNSNHIQNFSYREQVITKGVSLRDFNFKKPALDFSSMAEASNDLALSVYEYPAVFQEESTPDDVSAIRLQEKLLAEKLASGRSDRNNLCPGYLFTLEDHNVSEFNIEYVITRVRHRGQQPQVLEALSSGQGSSYQNTFEAIPSDVVYRPIRKTRKPQITGVQTAIVVGPAGEEIYTDEFGRVKVQFHWDELGQKDENSSCWVRVSQLWAGAGWGAMFIPRIGQEVIVEFVNGDPDRPIITGRVYHGTNKPPYTLPDEKTKSTIRSNTSLGGGSANELLMEDKADETQVVLSNAYGHKLTQDEKEQVFTLETRDQHKLVMDDKNKLSSFNTTNGHTPKIEDSENNGEGKISITSTNGHLIEIDDLAKTLKMQSVDGHVFLIDDENKLVSITTTNGHSVVMSDNDENITMTSTGGHTFILDDSAGVMSMEDSGGNLVKLDGNGSKITIECASGDIDVSAASGKISLAAMEVEIAADMDLKMSGGMNASMEGGLEAKVSGTMAKLEGSAMTDVIGGLVKIN